MNRQADGGQDARPTREMGRNPNPKSSNPKSKIAPLRSSNPKSKIAQLRSEEWLEIGTIVASQGLDGEVRVYPDSDFPERFEVPGVRWLLRPGETEPQSVELVAGRYLEGKNLYVIKLAGVENRNQAEELRGCKLMVSASDRPQLGEDEYHVLDLIGMFVFMQETGELVGTVVDVIPAGNDILEVQLHQQEDAGTRGPGESKIQNRATKIQKAVLIPFVKAIAPVVDLASGRIEITPPPGLLEIND